MKKKRNRYTKEFKEAAVKLITEQGYQITEAARNLGVNANLLGRWKREMSMGQNGSPILTAKVNQLLDTITVLPLDSGVEFKYAELRLKLEKAGTPIGGNDLLIAAHALSTNLIVVTANEREFSRVPELTVENWLKP